MSRLNPEVAIRAIETNCLGALNTIQALLPALAAANDGRIVNISSGMGAFDRIRGDHAAYRLSKACLNALSRMMAAELPPNVTINAMCPGWVRTDMGGPDAPATPAQGADTAVWLAFDAPPAIRGKFLRDRAVIQW